MARARARTHQRVLDLGLEGSRIALQRRLARIIADRCVLVQIEAADARAAGRAKVARRKALAVELEALRLAAVAPAFCGTAVRGGKRKLAAHARRPRRRASRGAIDRRPCRAPVARKVELADEAVTRLELRCDFGAAGPVALLKFWLRRQLAECERRTPLMRGGERYAQRNEARREAGGARVAEQIGLERRKAYSVV